MRNTQRKGDLAVATAIARLTALEYDVSLPITESAAYDMIADDGELHRVQVKYSKSLDVDLRRIHSNSKGYVVKEYDDGSYDWLFVYKPDGICYLIKRNCHGKHYVRPKVDELI